jgi:hypothetical protein
VVLEWMATITGDHVGYPRFRDLGDFSPKKEKNLGEHKFARLSASNFCGRISTAKFRYNAKVLKNGTHL